MKIEIKNRFSGEIIICGKYESIKDCLEKNKRANLSGADLFGANLSGANLSGADLSGADLFGANLFGADLFGADLSGVNLSGADLFGEKLDKQPIQILGLKWSVMITKQHIKIGCEFHKADEWNEFSNEEISKMNSRALDWWKDNKKIIMDLHEKHCKE